MNLKYYWFCYDSVISSRVCDDIIKLENKELLLEQLKMVKKRYQKENKNFLTRLGSQL